MNNETEPTVKKTFLVMQIEYSFAQIEADTEEEALEIAEEDNNDVGFRASCEGPDYKIAEE